LSNSGARADAPVFIVGSARSGNTLLYHTLLSSGGFANYRGEPAVFDLIAPKFGSLAVRRNRERLLTTWLRSEMYRISGLEPDAIRDRVLNECRGRGDFLRIVMSEVARSQGLKRWAVWGPDNLLYMTSIKAEIPDALFIHVIRDGRDVAVSMCREGWIASFPWDRKQGLLTAALHWKWKVEHGIRSGRHLGADYIEVHFEDLVANRLNTLARVSSFLAQDLDASQIRRHAVGTLAAPNSTFQGEVRGDNFQPVERWRHILSAVELATLESSIGPLLQSLGYALETDRIAQPGLRQRLAQALYPRYFDVKQWLKLNTVLGRMTSVERLHLTH
jgi:LPS sulfotransferase NodH